MSNRYIRFANADRMPGVYLVIDVDDRKSYMSVRPVGREARAKWGRGMVVINFETKNPDFSHEYLVDQRH